MRIVLVAQHFAPEFEGGSERVVRDQARLLVARGHRVRVVAGSDRPGRGEAEEAWCGALDGFDVTILRRAEHESYDLLLDRPRLVQRVVAACGDTEVAHVHHWSTLGAGLVRALAARVPVVVTLHDHFTTCARFFRSPPRADLTCPAGGDREPCVPCLEPDAGGLPPGAIREGLARRGASMAADLAAAARLIAPSAYHARRTAELVPVDPDAIEVLPHGLAPGAIGTTAATAAVRAPAIQAGRREGPLSVLHFGHLSREKGTLDLARAVAGLGPGSARLVLAGALLQETLETELASVLPPDGLVLRGPYAAPSELAGAAADCDLAAFPSRLEESYGRVVDESLALGLPTWVSDRGALGERLGGAGRILPAADPDAWREALAAAQRDRGELERQRAALPGGLADAEATVERLEAIYAEVAGAAGARR